MHYPPEKWTGKLQHYITFLDHHMARREMAEPKVYGNRSGRLKSDKAGLKPHPNRAKNQHPRHRHHHRHPYGQPTHHSYKAPSLLFLHEVFPRLKAQLCFWHTPVSCLKIPSLTYSPRTKIPPISKSSQDPPFHLTAPEQSHLL